MKPKLLRMAGIGSFPQEITIDFEHLDATGLYLVVGPTGAGKTTIFEAMSYALFAKVPSGRDIESTFPHERSFIDFTFSHGGADHRVVRDNTKANGDYYERLPKGTRVAQRRAVTQHVEELLKLTADQFMKIILLPQGQFQEFLVAKTSEKEEILQRIFGTEIYDSVAECVADLTAELAMELDEIASAMNAASDSVANDLRSVRSAYPDLELPEDTSDFVQARKVVESRIPEAEKLSEAAAGRVQELSGNLALAKNLEQLFNDNQQLQKLRTEAEEGSALLKDATESLHAHQRAERALRQKDDLDAAATALESTTSQRELILRDLRREAARLKLELPQVTTFRGAIESSQNLPEEFGAMSRAVTTALEALVELAGLDEELDDAKSQTDDFNDAIKDLTTSITKLEAEKKRLSDERAAANALAGKHADLQRNVDALDLLLESADVEEATRRLTAATKSLERATTALASSEKALQAAQKYNEHHLAGQLAKQLRADESCPVCGSTEHPKPARSSKKIDVQAAIDRHAEARTAVSHAKREVLDAEKALVAATKAESKLPTVSEQKRLRDQLQRAEAASKARARIERSYESVVDRLAEAKEDKTRCATELRNTKATIKRVTTAIARVKADAPPRLGDAQRRETTQAVTRLRDLVGKKHSLDQTHARQTTKFTTLDNAVEQALKKEGFRRLDDATTARLTATQQQRNEQLIEKGKQRETKIIGLAARVEGKSIPKERPDTRVLDRELGVQRNAQNAATTKLAKITSLRDRLVEHEARLEDLRPKAESAQVRLNEARILERAMNTGHGVGINRVYRLQEWIQRRLFEQVCRVASRQLHELTAGRYSITLVPDADSAVKHAQGLDLYVLDSFNGKKRGVGSLSGGETFLASLALALALAEVVQTHAGGIKIPCLFIDEGFGSLDQETLESAMDALLKLQHSGRTVGVITHVETMQRQLPIGIRVVKSDAGSRLEFPLLQ
jgi:exonuclease SbcC